MVKKLFCDNKFFDIDEKLKIKIPEEFHQLIEYWILASKKDPFDPMEKALENVGHKIDHQHIHNFPLIEEYPLSRELLSLSYVWKNPDQDGYLIASKWAPEAIIDLCHCSKEQKKKIEEKIEEMAMEWLRVLGVARAIFKGKDLPKSQHDFEFEFLWLIGWMDPIRPAVSKAIKECYSAWIKVIMITGDYPTTAKNIAKEIWLQNPDQVITWQELRTLDENQLLARLKTTNIIARVVPEEKLTIVNLLKKNGLFVAMTWDGVNDAPALKAADIWIAMGERWTDVAREASWIVILDDDFSSIVQWVRMGRKIFDNLKKAMVYIVGVHVPIAWLGLIPVLLWWPIMLYPIHIVFLELLIDPSCSVVFESEKEEENIMKQKPRSSKEHLLWKRTIFVSLVQWFFSLVMVIAILKFALSMWWTDQVARTMTFATLIIGNISLILVNRSWSKNMFAMLKVKNPALLPVIIWALVFLLWAIYIPWLQKIFNFANITAIQLIIAISAGLISVIRFEWVKKVFQTKHIALLKD